MTESDHYETIRQKLKLGPLIAPKHKKVEKLLRIFWNEEEAEILSQFNGCDTPTTLRELVDRTGKSKQEIKNILKASLRKKTIIRLGTRYSLIPLVPGIFEHYFIRRKDTEENQKKVAEIYRYLFKHFLPSLIEDSDLILFRPRLPLAAKEKLIEIDESFDVQQQILSYELIEEIINKYEHFMTIPCQCRLIGEYAGEPCKVAPPELGCFLAGPLAKMGIDEGAPALTKEEAIEFIKKTEKAGLVHHCVADNSVDSGLLLCNCCNCHCGTLIPAKEHKKVASIPSNYIPKFNKELCTNCELCLRKCPMGAIYHRWPNLEDKSDEYMYLKKEFCIGCGVCANNCPNNALMLIKVGDNKFEERIKFGSKTLLDLLI